VDADVDSRDGDERRQGEEAGKGTAEEVAEEDRPRKARGRVPGGEGVPHRGAEQRVGVRERLVRAAALERHLEHEGDQVGSPHGPGREEGRADERPPGATGERGCERDPEQPGVAGDGEGEKEPVEGRDTVLDDPEEEVAIGVCESG
jgi:hypothetical protein